MTPREKVKVLSSKQIIKAIEDDRKSTIDIRLFALSIVQEMGGVQMMAVEYAKLFRALPQNSPMRIRLLEQMTKIISLEAEKPRPQLALDELDQDQLKLALGNAIEDVIQGMAKGGEEENEEAAS